MASGYGDDDFDDASTVCSVSDLASLPVDLSKGDKVECNLCGHCCGDPTPFTSMCHTVRYGKTWPWAKYHPVKSSTGEKISRRPTGKYCAICNNLFFMLLA